MNAAPTTSKPKKKTKTPSTVPIRISRETKRTIIKELSRINKEKEFGKRIKADAYIELAISLVRPEHLKSLKEQSMTYKDRFEQAYKDHLKSNGSISKDEFYGLVLRGEIKFPEIHAKSSKRETQIRMLANEGK